MEILSTTSATVTILLLSVAPGYIYRRIYRSVIPAHKPISDAALILTSVACSVMVIAVTDTILHFTNKLPPYHYFYHYITMKSDNSGYILTLLAIAAFLGYLAALLRKWKHIKSLLHIARFRDPDTDIYEKTIAELHPQARVTVLLKGNRYFSGIPQSGEYDNEAASQGLYFRFIRWRKPDGSWGPLINNGLLIPLSEIGYMEFDATKRSHTKSR